MLILGSTLHYLISSITMISDNLFVYKMEKEVEKYLDYRIYQMATSR